MAKTFPPLADFMPYEMAIASGAVSQLIANEYHARFGLKVPEWRVMCMLGHLGSATQRDIVRGARMDKVAVNRAAKALGERELIARSPNANDGRSHHLELTPTGQALYEEIMPLALDWETKVLAVLSKDELKTLKCMLKRLRERADELGAVRD